MLLNKKKYDIYLNKFLFNNHYNYFFINFFEEENIKSMSDFITINYFSNFILKNKILIYNKNIFFIFFKNNEIYSLFFFFNEKKIWEKIKFFGVNYNNYYLNCKNKFDLELILFLFFNINNYLYLKILEILLYIIIFINNIFFKIIFLIKLKC